MVVPSGGPAPKKLPQAKCESSGMTLTEKRGVAFPEKLPLRPCVDKHCRFLVPRPAGFLGKKPLKPRFCELKNLSLNPDLLLLCL